MRSRLHQFLAIFMACWMPFCCCQVRAAAAVVAHAGHSTTASEHADDSTTPPCCRAEASNDTAPAESDHHASGGCCDDDDAADAAHGKPKGTCCVSCSVSCKERVLPPAPVTIDHDEVGEIDFVSTAVLADTGFGLDPCAAALLARRDTGPPRAPAGRQALALHSTLVI